MARELRVKLEDGTFSDPIGSNASDIASGTLANARLDADLAAIGNLSAAEGFYRKTAGGTVTVHKSNLSASADPGATDDSAAGYSVGSVWINTSADTVWQCVDSTATAAVWKGGNFEVHIPIISSAVAI